MLLSYGQLHADRGEILQAILDQSQDCVKLLTPAGDLEYMNGNGRSALGISDFNAVAGQPWAAMWPPSEFAHIDSVVQQAAAGHSARFEAFCPTMRGEPRWWDVAICPIRDQQGTIVHLLATSRDVTRTRTERAAEVEARQKADRHAEERDIISREMRHRLKNLLAIVASIARLSARDKERVDDFLPLFERRIGALGDAQVLLADSERGGASLSAMVERLMAPVAGDPRLTVEAMPERLIDETALHALVLVLGELLTNAQKYGALSDPAGSIRLSATRGDGRLRIVWDELFGRALPVPATSGDGSRLMKRMTAALAEPLSVAWREDGMVAQFAYAI